MNPNNRPISEIIKNRDMEEPKKRSREDWRKAKELEEARKAGTAPAAVDEEGRDINPHIPQYIATAPWYFGSSCPTLKHQRPQPERQQSYTKIEEHFVRGLKAKTATKYRKGACENCGALTHTKKNCFERPRKIGAKFTNEDIAEDEVILPDLNLDYDGKRDRWNGYDPANYQAIVEEFAKVEEAKRQLKEEKLKQDLLSGEVSTIKETVNDDEDEEKYADNADMPGTKVDSKQRITVRNLRIREDIAKYLRNLDPNSAYYDPKTRAMRDNPYQGRKNPEELQYAGDNFVRVTGDTEKHSRTQVFAWQAYEKGVDVHLQSEPTKAELLYKEFQVKKEEFKHSMKDNILDKYGGGEHLQVPPKELIFAQTEDYVEYSRHGVILKGTEKPIVRSKYEEDVFINNHTSVWGSYWCDGLWGYKCCHLFIKNSYCTGNSGKEAAEQASRVVILPPDNDDDLIEQVNEETPKEQDVPITTTKPKALIELYQEQMLEKKRQKRLKKKRRQRESAKRKAAKKSESSESESIDSDTSDEEKLNRKKTKKLKKALEEEEESKRKADRLLAMDERKRPYNSMYESKAPTEEQMEAYYIKRQRPDDPMAAFLTKD
ncbi:pre-mRNA-splicing factor SLU7 isoform X2 [Centruroides vittatus]|uniref:pre-mRNA-splicing factor SLU7 isoform X2 n=1 Tax=Centruroides vittatus TaxID=120091 RepID=UPI0035103627